MTSAEMWLVAAVLLGPFLAIAAHRGLDRLRERRERQRSVFRTLVRTRSNPASPEHAEALNLVDLDFSAREHDSVRRAAWRYAEHLEAFPGELNMSAETWRRESVVRLGALLDSMAKVLGYELSSGATAATFRPAGQGLERVDWMLIRRGLREWLDGERVVAVRGERFDARAAESAEPTTSNGASVERAEDDDASLVQRARAAKGRGKDKKKDKAKKRAPKSGSPALESWD